MAHKLIQWAVGNPLIVLLAGRRLGGRRRLCVLHVNVEAYPDPAPAIIEVIAQYPGATRPRRSSGR